jgi:hypothetical protein
MRYGNKNFSWEIAESPSSSSAALDILENFLNHYSSAPFLPRNGGYIASRNASYASPLLCNLPEDRIEKSVT